MMPGTPRSTRRDFLTGKAALDAVAPIDVGAPPGTPSAAQAGSHLLRLSRRAMACSFEVYLDAVRYKQGTEAALAALDRIDHLEDQLSVYRESSEISYLNRTATLGPVEVEAELFALLERAVDLYHQTGGAFDVTAGRLSQVWGFKRRQGSIPTATELADARESIGSELLELDGSDHSVRFRRDGLEINLGSIGKGYALDRAAGELLAAGIDDFLLHGGNSSVLARGTHGAVAGIAGWSVGVRNPLDPADRLGHLRLVDQALATSGSGAQFFIHEGRRYGHILDPRSGWPAEGVLSATVVASCAADADALATAFYVMGVDGARDYCGSHPDLGAVVICPGPQTGTVETHLLGRAETAWTPTGQP